MRLQKAQRLNPELPVNPGAGAFGSCNAILTGTSKKYYVENFCGPLSLKATLDGTSTWRVGSRDYRVSESTYLIVNAGQPYTISFDEPRDVTTFCLFFRDGYIEQLVSAKQTKLPAALDDPFRTAQVEFPVRLHDGSSKVLEELRGFARDLECQSIGREGWELRFQRLGEMLIGDLDRAGPRSADIRAAKESTRGELLRRVLVGRDFLISMSDRDISVENAARAACMSTFHFHRVFQQAFGVSPYTFLRNYRMSRASRMLRSSDIPVFEVAQRVGFISVGSFGNAFQRSFRMSPQAYRLAGRGTKMNCHAETTR